MLKKYIAKHWTAYLAIVIIPIIFWCAIYNILDDPKDNEKLSILLVGEGLDCEALQEYIVNNMGENRIKSISVESTTIYDSLYYDYLKAKCYDYDLVIFTEGNMREHVGRVVFEREIMLEQFEDDLPKSDYYYESIDGYEIPFGFVLKDENTDNLFSEFYTGEEKCYLFMSPHSVNLDQINGNGVKGDDFALKVLIALFEK